MKNNYSIAQRNAIVEDHLWCIDSIIQKNRPLMRAARLEYDDVYQQLAIRLIKAVAGYDPDMGVLLRKMLENLEEYDDPPVLTRVEKTISGFLFAYGGRDNQEDGPCVVYIVSETPVLPAKNKEEMK